MISFMPLLEPGKIKTILTIFFVLVCMSFIFVRSGNGIWAITIRNYFVSATFLIVGAVSAIAVGTIDIHSIVFIIKVLIPAMLVMGLIGQLIGSIMDNPKNREDADYKISVLNALKGLDKSMTLEELNDKLTKTVEEPDLPDETVEKETES